MPWLKRNLFLVVGAVIALGLLGFGVFFLLTKIKTEAEVTENLNTQTEALRVLAERDPHPNSENIEAAKADRKLLTGFLSETHKSFAAVDFPKNLNSRDFGVLLDRTVDRLKDTAQQSAVTIPDKYWFTFGNLRTLMNFEPASIEPLTIQVKEVESLCDILFQAKVSSLVSLQRAAIGNEASNAGSSATSDFLSAKIVTNEWAIVSPYIVAFQSFSGELGRVLEGLARTRSPAFVIKKLVVEPAPADGTTSEASPTPSYYPGAAPMIDPGEMFRRRYGTSGSRYGGGRYGAGPTPMAPQPQYAPRPAPRPGLETVLDEKMLKVTITLETVRLKPAAPASRQAPPQPATAGQSQ